MHGTRPRALAVILGTAVAVAVAGCGAQSTASSGTSNNTTFTLSVPPVGDSLPVYQAIDKGYFKDEGLTIKLVPAANGATAINALVSQSTDLALVSYPTLIDAHASGLPVTVAATGINGTDAYKSGLYVLNDSSIKAPADMVGKKMATPSLNSVGDIWFRGVLMSQGLDPSSVKYVEIPQANMASALKAGDVDGAFLTEPTLSAAKKQVNIRAIGYQNGPQGLFATSQQTLKDHAKAIAGFRSALSRAVADIDKDPHGVAEQEMPKYTKLDAQTAAQMNLPDYVTQWDGKSVQALVDLMVKEGIVKKSFDANQLYQKV